MPMEWEDEQALNLRRGRSGRPLMRLKAWLKSTGANVCWICAQPIDLDLDPNDKWGWTLDHALPLSKYPWLALDKANAREAHRTCNSSKGNRERRTGRISRDW